MLNKFENYITTIYFITIFFTLGNIFYFYRNLLTINNNENWIQHSYIVKSALDDVLQSITNAETGERGYLISGNKVFLSSYVNALPKINKDIANVKALTSDNPEQQERIPQLSKLTKERILYLKQAINLRGQQGFDVLSSLTNVGQGRIAMIQIQQLITTMQSTEDTLLQQRVATNNKTYKIIYITSALTGLLNLILIALSYYLIRKEFEKKIAIKQAIENSEKRFRSLIEHSYEAVALINHKDEITYVSPSIKRINGFTSKEYIKINRFTRIHKEDKEKVKEIYATLKPGETRSIILQVKNKSGKWKWLEVVYTNLFNDKNINAIVANFRDVTERKELEIRKEEFISMASHELKTPITSMKMFLDILQRQIIRYEDAKAEKYIQTLKNQTDKLKELTADLLDVSRIETGKLTFRREDVDLCKIIKDIVEVVQPTMIKHKIVFKDEKQVNVFIDRYRMFQVLTNLLTNASKYSPKAEKILIKLKKTATVAVVSVQDFGIGIDNVQKGKIFDKLYQVSDTEEKTFPGLGMGLFISKEIIERHGGKIWVESVRGKGSTFFFSLPLKK